LARQVHLSWTARTAGEALKHVASLNITPLALEYFGLLLSSNIAREIGLKSYREFNPGVESLDFRRNYQLALSDSYLKRRTLLIISYIVLRLSYRTPRQNDAVKFDVLLRGTKD